MQQPNQSPPGCNPYAVNNKGIAHLLLILLLVAGLSVVGMFLFKMVSGEGFNVLGIRTAQAPDPDCRKSIICMDGYTKTSCIVSYNPYQSGYKCVVNKVYWNYLGCSTSMPSCRSDQEIRRDCVRGDGVSGYRCVQKTTPPTTPPITPPPSGENPSKDPACNKKTISECSGGTYANPCYYPSGGVPYGFKCVNVPLPAGYSWSRPSSCSSGYSVKEVILSYDPPGPAREATYTTYRCMRSWWVGTIGLGGGFSGRVAVGVGDADFNVAVNGNIPRINFGWYAIPNIAYLVPQTGPWNYSNCNAYVDIGQTGVLKRIGQNELANSCQPGQTVQFDCRRQSSWSILETGWRCVNNSPTSGQCVYVVPNCAPGTIAQPCLTVSASGQGSVNVNGIEVAGAQWQGSGNVPLYRCVGGVNNTPIETGVSRPTIKTCYGGYNVYVSSNSYTGCCSGNTVKSGTTFKCIQNQPTALTDTVVHLPVVVTTAPVVGITPSNATCIKRGTSGDDRLPCCTSGDTTDFVRIAGEGRLKICRAPSTRPAVGPVQQASNGTTPCVLVENNRFGCGAKYEKITEVCDNGGFICLPKDTDKDGVTDPLDDDLNGDKIPDYKQPGVSGPVNETIFIPPVGVGVSVETPGNGSTPPSNSCATCVTASGSFKTTEGRPVEGADVVVYLGNGSTAGTTKTDASGNFSLRFDKKGINFAIRSVSTSYKPARTSYPECKGISGVGYEDCWFKPQNMTGVDFVSTGQAVDPNRKPPTAEITSLSSITPVQQNRKISTVVRVKAYGSKVGKVTLYANPAYSSSISVNNPRCSDEAVGSYQLYSTQKRWIKVGEVVYNASNAFESGFVTISWNTDSLPCTLADTRADGVCTGSYFLGANVEDLGDMPNIGKAPVNVLRCTSNPSGNACSPNNTYYQGLCGNTSYSRLDVVPSEIVDADPVPSLIIFAKGTPVKNIGPKMDLYVKGTLVKSWYVTEDLSSYTYSHDSKVELSASDIKIGFSNDASDPANKEDRNLFVDYIQLYGVKYQTEDASTLSTGVWDKVTSACIRTPSVMKSELLGCNGYFQFNGSNTLSSDTTVSIVAAGPSYQGIGPKMDLYINDVLVKTWYVGSTLSTYTYSVKGNNVTNVKVGFSNDVYVTYKDQSGKVVIAGRDLTVDYIKVGSEVYQTEAAGVIASGVWSSPAHSCVKATGSGIDRLVCNGYFQYMIPTQR